MGGTVQALADVISSINQVILVIIVIQILEIFTCYIDLSLLSISISHQIIDRFLWISGKIFCCQIS